MRFMRRQTDPDTGADLTPMIDVVFQLIAFFMVIINFTEAEQNERIKLPSSILARPPDAPQETPLTLQMDENGVIYFASREVTVDSLAPLLQQERNVMQYLQKDPAQATIIIRAHQEAKAGSVQELIRTCQDVGFEKFVLRAKQELDT